MKTITVTAFGGPETLAVSQAADPVAGPGQALIAVEAAGVGLVDVFQRSGRYPGLTEPGFVPGIEVAGTVAAVGEGADASLVGRRVFAMVPNGGYAEMAVAPAAALVPLPDGVSCSQAVALGINALVAQFTFDQAHLAAGEQVLVRGAGGGIGVIAVQVAAHRGAKVAAGTSSAERGEKLKALGATTVVNRNAEGDGAAATYDVIIDPVAGADIVSFISKLNPGGRHVMVGFAGGLPGPDLAMGLVMNFMKSISLSTFSLNSNDPAKLVSALGKMFDAVASGTLKAVIDEELPLDQAAAAHAKLEAGAFGKVVLVNR